MINIQVREAVPNDITTLTDQWGREFFNESKYRAFGEYQSPEGAYLIAEHIHGSDSDFLISHHNGYVTGGCGLSYRIIGLSRPFAFYNLFFIRPKFRGTPSARKLIEFSIEKIKLRNCAAAFASPQAGFSSKNDQLMINLFQKFGFVNRSGSLELEI